MSADASPGEADSVQVETLFKDLVEYLNSDQLAREEIKIVVRELEQTARELATMLQGIHGIEEAASGGDIGGGEIDSLEPIRKLCESSRKTLGSQVRVHYASIAEKVPAGQYYRFHDHWRFVTQRLCFLSALVVFLETSRLASYDQVAEMLGLATKADALSQTFHLELEDYLQGLLQLGSELSRYAVNCVTAGDYARPVVIAKFIGELDAGFRLLNLKNDHLRKRFDALKYDLKKCEEVVYDITLRGLAPRSVTVAPGAAGSTDAPSASPSNEIPKSGTTNATESKDV